MGIEDLRWYHWLPLGLALGAAVGAVRLGTRRPFEDLAVRTIGRGEFDAALSEGLPDGRSAVRSLVVHPPRGDGVWWVTGSRVKTLQLHADPTNAASPRVDADVRTPFKMPAGGADIWDDLRKMHAAFPRTAPPPSYAWPDVPLVQMTLWMAGLGGLVGGVWPPVMALLIGAGFGRRSNDPAYDLDRFSSEPVPPDEPQADKTAPPVDDLSDDLPAEDEPVVSPPALAPPRVRTLSAQPVTPTPAAPSGPPKEFAGQFYPTQVHAPAPKRPGC